MMVFRKLFSRKRPRLKQQLIIMQDKDHITIEGVLGNPAYTVKELTIYLRNDDDAVDIPNEQKNNHFKFTLDLKEYEQLFEKDEGLYNLSLIVSVPESALTEKQIKSLQIKPSTSIDTKNKLYEYPIRLGRFKETISKKLESTMINGKKVKLYKTVKGNISLAVNSVVEQSTKIQIDYLKSKKHEMYFGGKLFTRTYNINQIGLLVIGRDNNIETRFPVTINHMIKETEKKFGLNRYQYDVILNLYDLVKDDHDYDDVYDLFLEIQFEDLEEQVLVRIGKPRFKARYRIKSSSASKGDKVFALSPYYTFRNFNLSLQIDSFEKSTYEFLKKMLRWSFFVTRINKNKNVWVIGEKPNKGQDTGYHFFKYVRKNHPEKNVYYIIEKNSPEAKNVEPYGNVVYFKSKEHIKLILMATRVIGSHHADYLYPIRTTEFDKKMKAKKVFLQHGVMGTKNMTANYGKNAPGFDTDLFLVSSNFEREMIINDFGYHENEVVVTGLSRFDSLFQHDINVKKQLLIIPTWREWLVRDDLFLQSEYYERYKELVYNEKLHGLAAKYNFEIIFCLHPNMQKFSHYFREAPVRVINQGEVNVQDLLKESAMMITDYSSVAFDFSFLEKPIIYYQFDRRRFIGAKGSHIDLDHDLPGDIVYELDEINSITEQYAKNNFAMKEEKKRRAAKFLTYKDQLSSRRIYEAINNKVRKKSLLSEIQESELFRILYNRFRKNKYYPAVMKLFYNIARRIIPINTRLILFESGLGKQYTDSPKAIYEEIVNRNLDYKKVWVYNKNIRFKDSENTIRINRLSPSYFYYLARAGIWVNNQNFPTYIKKRKETIYLQTWHGTPLKKMLHDIDYVRGRSDDYLKRVSSAIKNWDYLISPSKYASNAFKSAFKYEGEILETGYPRNDIFYQADKEEIADHVRSRLMIPKNKKVLLYAPTFRDNQTTKNNRFTFDIEMDLHKMQEALGDEYIILLRMHVIVRNKIKLDEELESFVMDVSNYPDMQELLLITDILITDYSSVMFDFANTKKPMLFFTFDLETYRDDVRGFYMDFEKEAPGPFVRTTEEIIKSIGNITEVEKAYEQKYKNFHEKFCSLEDGAACARVVDVLVDGEEGKNLSN